MKNHLLPFAVAFVVFSLLLLGLDIAIMKFQGLTLFFTP